MVKETKGIQQKRNVPHRVSNAIADRHQSLPFEWKTDLYTQHV